MKLKEYLQIIADNKDDDFEVIIGNNEKKYITYKGLLDNYSDLTIYRAESKADNCGNTYHELKLTESQPKGGNTMKKYQVELKATVNATGLDELQRLTALADYQTKQLNETLEKINKMKITFDMEVK
ncbi:MAG: hypothetical protein ACRCZN_02015 [Lactococcus lactis]